MELIARVTTSLGITSGVSKAGNPWQKGELVVETEGEYPKKIALSNMKNAEEFARLPIGALVKFKIDIESREYNGKWYTNVNAYAFELQEQSPMQSHPQQGYAPQPQQPSQAYVPKGGYQPQPQQGYGYPPQQQGYQQPYAQPPQSDDDIPF